MTRSYRYSIISTVHKKTMAKMKGGGLFKTSYVPGAPKMTRQGRSANTKVSATSRNGKKKPYRGQGR